MKILITGATGLIGRPLCERLTRAGHTVVAVSRAPERAGRLAAAEVLRWEPQAGPPPAAALAGTEAVIHLAGEPIADRRWSDEQKRRLRDSRILSTRHLVEAMLASPDRPRVLVSGSAVGIYGNRGDEELPESAPPGTGFLADLCKAWEAEARRAAEAGIRVPLLRTGVVLSAEGGALKKMLTPFKLGVAGPLGSGRQWFPWIHLDDILGLIELALHNESINGPLNGAAPAAVTNAEFTRQLAGVLHRPAFLPVPEFGLRLLMGEMADVVLVSQHVVPRAALDAGYMFGFPHLRPALEDLLNAPAGRQAA